MQFVYPSDAAHISLEWRYICLGWKTLFMSWQAATKIMPWIGIHVSCHGKLLHRLSQFIFAVMDVKSVLLKNFLYLLSCRIFRAPFFPKKDKSNDPISISIWFEEFLSALHPGASGWTLYTGRTKLSNMTSVELFYEDLLAVDRPIFTAIKFFDLHGWEF